MNNILDKVFELEDVNRKLYKKVKKSLALTIAIEECSELVQAIAKIDIKNDPNLENLHEEIADVIVGLTFIVSKLNVRKVDILSRTKICIHPTLMGSVNKLAYLQQAVSKNMRNKGVPEITYVAISGVITSLNFLIKDLELDATTIKNWIVFKDDRLSKRICDNTFK